MNFEETLNNLQEKIGKDSAGLIADDIASLLSYENARNKEVKKKDKEIEKLKETKEKLIEANGNLLQQISVETKEVDTYNSAEIKQLLEIIKGDITKLKVGYC